MKKKIDSLVSFYKETTEVNNLVKKLNPKLQSLQEKIDTMNKESWLTDENVIKRKKVSLKSNFCYLSPEKRIDRNFPISSLHIAYVGEINHETDNEGLGGIYLCLTLKRKSGDYVEIGIASNDGCSPIPMLNFDKLRNHMTWENCSIEFTKIEDLEIVIDFCESAVKEVNEKLTGADLSSMGKRFYY